MLHFQTDFSVRWRKIGYLSLNRSGSMRHHFCLSYVFFCQPNIGIFAMDSVEGQINELKKTVAYDTRDFIIETLVSKYTTGLLEEKNEIYVPEYQRDFVWDSARQSRLIESIILGLPIPSIFVAEGADGRLEVVDGSQRIRTLSAFLKGELELQSLEKVTRLNGLRYSDLDESRKRKFGNTAISVIVLSEAANEDTRNDLFERINKGSDILRNMETRKGVYRGDFTDFIYKDCSPNLQFRRMIKLAKTVRDRQEYEELILRFFALIDSYPRFVDFSSSVQKALDAYMDQKRVAFDDMEKGKKRVEFERMLNFVADNFEHGFAKRDGQYVSRIFFEAISVGVHFALEKRPGLTLSAKVDVGAWITDKDFKKSISGDYKTHATATLKKRIDFVTERLLQLGV